MKPNSKPNDKKKKVVVIVLLAGLLLVVGWQSLSPKSSDGEDTAAPSTLVVAPPTGPLTGSAALTALVQRLPKVDLEQILAHDPFQLLAGTDSTDPNATSLSSSDSDAGLDATAQLDTVRSESPTLQVSAILHGGPRPAVMIGQQLYYEKDRLEGGWRILAIHADRVTVERMDDAP
ncbi:MAG: hypothetical protein Q8M16_07620 [Pirellulaceae bacterium]|nr:hypothetical protein [Pirellulaceae bacterium]